MIIEVEPMNANAYLNRGCCYEKQKKTDLAYKDYETSLVIDKILENMDGSGGTSDKININHNDINENSQINNSITKKNSKENSNITSYTTSNKKNDNNSHINNQVNFVIEKEKRKNMNHSVNNTLTHLTNLSKRK